MKRQFVLMRIPRLGAAAASITVIAMSPGLAQQPQAQADEEIVVTGSFIERPADRPQPVTVLSAEELNLWERL